MVPKKNVNTPSIGNIKSMYMNRAVTDIMVNNALPELNEDGHSLYLPNFSKNYNFNDNTMQMMNMSTSINFDTDQKLKDVRFVGVESKLKYGGNSSSSGSEQEDGKKKKKKWHQKFVSVIDDMFSPKGRLDDGMYLDEDEDDDF